MQYLISVSSAMSGLLVALVPQIKAAVEREVCTLCCVLAVCCVLCAGCGVLCAVLCVLCCALLKFVSGSEFALRGLDVRGSLQQRSFIRAWCCCRQ